MCFYLWPLIQSKVFQKKMEMMISNERFIKASFHFSVFCSIDCEWVESGDDKHRTQNRREFELLYELNESIVRQETKDKGQYRSDNFRSDQRFLHREINCWES